MLRRSLAASAAALIALAVPLAGYALKAQPHHVAHTLSLTAFARQVAGPVPVRNLYQLADEYRLRPPRTISKVVRTTSPNYAIGHEDSFWLLGEDTNKYFKIHARVVAETPHLYLYIQDGVKYDAAAANTTAQHFEQSIYPTDRKFFGSEWTPGVDGDPHITCLVANLHSQNVGGSFSAEDEFPKSVYRYSNQREMVEMNSADVMPGDSTFSLILSHEFQHMIHDHLHPRDSTWLNEGMSMLAEQVNHFAPNAEPSAYVAQPDTQLNGWSEDSRVYAHYGAAYLYLSYLYDRFGSGLIHDLVADGRLTDFALISDVLKKHHIPLTADQIFNQWVIANWVHDRSIAGGIYGYTHTDWRITKPTYKLSAQTPVQSTVPAYAPQYTSVDVPADGHAFHLQFSAPSTVPLISASGGSFWWSNRGDQSDMRLVRTVDLRHVRHATLHFGLWYNIEKDYDYGFVSASTDGGKTWTSLRGTHTTTADPTGANYGNGYTGTSKGWRQESVDLSRFAGHSVRLRFEYVTDDAYNLQGLAVRQISIPEIGFHDSFTGWTQHGWLPVSRNALPNHWVVRLIQYTKQGVKIGSMAIDAAGHGQALVQPATSGLQKLVVEVHSMAPKTLVRSTYHLSLG